MKKFKEKKKNNDWTNKKIYDNGDEEKTRRHVFVFGGTQSLRA